MSSSTRWGHNTLEPLPSTGSTSGQPGQLLHELLEMQRWSPGKGGVCEALERDEYSNLPNVPQGAAASHQAGRSGSVNGHALGMACGGSHGHANMRSTQAAHEPTGDGHLQDFDAEPSQSSSSPVSQLARVDTKPRAPRAVRVSAQGSDPAKAKADNIFRRMSRSALEAAKASSWEDEAKPLCDRAFMFLPKYYFPRKQCIQLVSVKLYDWAMIGVILANCVVLAMTSNAPGFDDTQLGRRLAIAERVFLAIFSAEVVVKMVAYGLWAAPRTYLRDGWNWLDCVVVLLGWLEYVSSSNYSAIRSVRVLRPLRTITKIEKMRIIVVTLLRSIPMLIDVLCLAGFYFTIFGVLTLQLFAGTLSGRCSTPDFSNAYTELDGATGQMVLRNVSYITVSGQDDDVCAGPLSDTITWVNASAGPGGELLAPATYTPMGYSNRGTGGWICDYAAPSPELNDTSGTQDVALLRYGAWCAPQGNPENGLRHFDNILWSWLTIFQCITMTDWVFVMYNTQDGYSVWTWPIFFAAVALGAFFIVNLALAVLYLQFSKDREEEEDLAAEREAAAEARAQVEAAAAAAGQLGKGMSSDLDGTARSSRSSPDKTTRSSNGSETTTIRELGASISMLARYSDEGEEEEDLKAGKAGAGGQLVLGDRMDDTALFVGHSGGRLGRQGVEFAGDDADLKAGSKQRVHIRVEGRGGAALWRRLRGWCHWLTEHPHFHTFTTVVIVANAIVMAFTWYPNDPTRDQATSILNYVFTIYFVFEMAVKLAGMGAQQYMADGMNNFDALVTFASLVEMALDLSPAESGLGSTLSVLRAFRLLRLFRLARRWRNLQRIIQTLMRSVSSVGYLTGLLLLFMFICALLGMQLFGYKFAECTVSGSVSLCPPGLDLQECPSHFDCYIPCDASQNATWIEADGSPYGGQAYCESFPRHSSTAAYNAAVQEPDGSGFEYWAQVGDPDILRGNFDTFWMGFITIFQVLTFDNWADVMHEAMSKVSPWSALYFVAVIVIGNYMILNLFLAILLDNFGVVSEELGPSQAGDRSDDRSERTSVLTTMTTVSRGPSVTSSHKPGRDSLDEAGYDDDEHEEEEGGKSGGAVVAKSGQSQVQGRVPSKQVLGLQRAPGTSGFPATMADAQGGEAGRGSGAGSPGIGSLKGIAAVIAATKRARLKVSERDSSNRGSNTVDLHLKKVSTFTNSFWIPASAHSQMMRHMKLLGVNMDEPPKDEDEEGDGSGSEGSEQQGPGTSAGIAGLRGGLLRSNKVAPAVDMQQSGPIFIPPEVLLLPGAGQEQGKSSGLKQAAQLMSPSPRPSATGQVVAEEAAQHGRGSPHSTSLRGNKVAPDPRTPSFTGDSFFYGERGAGSPDGHEPVAGSPVTVLSKRHTAELQPIGQREGSHAQGVLRPVRADLLSEAGRTSFSGSGACSPTSDTKRSPLGGFEPGSGQLAGARAATRAGGPGAVAEGREGSSLDKADPYLQDFGMHAPPLAAGRGVNGSRKSGAANRESSVHAPAAMPKPALKTGNRGNPGTAGGAGGQMESVPHEAIEGSSHKREEAPAPGLARGGSTTQRRGVSFTAAKSEPEVQDLPSDLRVRASRRASVTENGVTSTENSQVSRRSSISPGAPGYASGGATPLWVSAQQQALNKGPGGLPSLVAPSAPSYLQPAVVTPTVGSVGNPGGAGARHGHHAHGHRGRTAFHVSSLLRGRSLFLFPPKSEVRCLAARIVMHRWFEQVMLFLILASSVILCLDDPSLDPDSHLRKALNVLDIFFTAAFGIEAVLKIVMTGLVVNGHGSYLRSPWNCLDAFVVLIGVVVLIVEAAASGQRQNLVWLRALRALRALRPLRAASRAEGIRTVVTALFKAIPALGNVVLVASLFYFIFAILAINLLAGKMGACFSSDGQGNYQQLDSSYLMPGDALINRTWCIEGTEGVTISASEYHSALGVSVPPWNVSTEWRQPFMRFDNVLVATWTLFQMATMEMWSQVMYAACDTTDVDVQPSRDHNVSVSIFFIIYMVVGSFFILNLVVGVSIDKFNEMKAQTGGISPLLTPQQEQWVRIQKIMATTQLKTRYKPPVSRFRLLFYHLTTSTVWDWCMMSVIIANIIFMFLFHDGQDSRWNNTLSAANAAFTGIFTAEVFLKWIGIGPTSYFSEGWNRFDFFVVCLSIPGVVIDYATTKELKWLPLIRVLRVTRVFRLIPHAKGLRTLLQTLVWSLPALFNVGSVLFLFMFIYAVIGMNLWGNVVYGGELSRHANFSNFPMSMLLLFRMMTGENWNGVMTDCMTQESCMKLTRAVTLPDGEVLPEGSYIDLHDDRKGSIPEDALNNQCSVLPVLSVAYFCSYIVLVALLLLQLVIGIILENIQSSAAEEELLVSGRHIEQFIKSWEELDPYATSYIDTIHLTTLLLGVDPPLGVAGVAGARIKIQEIVMETEIPNRGNRLHFLEVLHALAGRVAGAELPPHEEYTIHNRLIARLPKDVELPKYSAAHFYAAMYVQGAVRGFMARHRLRPLWDAAATEGDQGTAASGLIQADDELLRAIGVSGEEVAAEGGLRAAKLSQEQKRALVEHLRTTIATRVLNRLDTWKHAAEREVAEREREEGGNRSRGSRPSSVRGGSLVSGGNGSGGSGGRVQGTSAAAAAATGTGGGVVGGVDRASAGGLQRDGRWSALAAGPGKQDFAGTVAAAVLASRGSTETGEPVGAGDERLGGARPPVAGAEKQPALNLARHGSDPIPHVQTVPIPVRTSSADPAALIAAAAAQPQEGQPPAGPSISPSASRRKNFLDAHADGSGGRMHSGRAYEARLAQATRTSPLPSDASSAAAAAANVRAGSGGSDAWLQQGSQEGGEAGAAERGGVLLALSRTMKRMGSMLHKSFVEGSLDAQVARAYSQASMLPDVLEDGVAGVEEEQGYGADAGHGVAHGPGTSASRAAYRATDA